ncbi:N-acetylmuramoyl-L-alanine amidase [Candidatus Rhodobacter oscarellae]|uniref:N-acetylmuramoyl-L-alanine amidase n=1 Tax=Candidatus Rhodobacter oscarellae TaxID=1675527 RepID=A0A0J9H3R4_9RHOB|nr:SH3 domain-containing protein [Candidatus Rhodobacter lobularis]KMW60318.1 N-acetylmuramoyl-L-alanine amidase [Candidatus Rhodobacter lobularis]
MVRFISFLVIALVMAVSARAELLYVNSPNDGFLNLRTGPGGGFNVIMRMGHGTSVNTLEIAGNWARVEHQSGAVGWAHRKYMVRPVATPARLFVYSPGDGFLNLRTGPGSGFTIITRMYHGSWVEVLERRGNWVRVFHEYGDEGWAYIKYLRQ